MAKEFSKHFYDSKAWKQCRQAYITSVYGLCERCGRPGDILHHRTWLTPDNINNPEITLAWSNLELLCQDCHNKEHMAKDITLRNDITFDEFGQVVYRPPIKEM